MATQSHLREINRRKVVEAMLRLKVATRAQIARSSGLSQPTVARLTDLLLRERFISEASVAIGSEVPQPGRPSQLLELDRSQRRFLAIELGVQQTRLAALPVGVGDEDTWDLAFPTPASAKLWSQALADTLGQLAIEHPQAIILSMPGVVDEPTGKAILCPNIRWTERADLAGLLRQLSPAPQVFIQEIRALALGQLLAEPTTKDFLLMDIGSGVGAAAVVNGQLYRGPLAVSGELGHIPVVGNNRPCGCGGTGCVETLVSRTGLLHTARDHRIANTWSELVEQVRLRGIQDWLRPSLDALAVAIISGVNMMGLETVLLSGIPAEIPTVGEYILRAIERGAMWGRLGEVRVRTIRRRRTAGMVLAAIERVSLGESL